MPTLMITGCSSGFGLETARYFLEREWNVIATMRLPDDTLLPRSERLRLLSLDVTDPGSIQRAVAVAGPVDALVNNAGVGLLSAIEGTSMETVREIFDTNVFGTLALVRAFVPQLRERRAGVIVNVSSSVTLKPLPLLAVYSASKAAVNAYTDSLALELAPFNIRVRLVLPGRAPQTRFGENARARMQGGIPPAYDELAQRVFAGWTQGTQALTTAGDVAEAVWRAVTDAAAPPRLPAGADAVALAGAA